MQSLQISDEADGGDDDDPFTEKLMSFEVVFSMRPTCFSPHVVQTKITAAYCRILPRTSTFEISFSGV